MVIKRLFDLYENAEAQSAYKILANYMLNERLNLEYTSLYDVIDETGLSKSTIVRFCQHVGTMNYTDFRYHFIKEYKNYSKHIRIDYHHNVNIDSDIILNKYKNIKKIIIFGGSQETSLFRIYQVQFYILGYLIHVVHSYEKEKISIDQDDLLIYVHMYDTVKVYFDKYFYNKYIHILYDNFNNDSKKSISIGVGGLYLNQSLLLEIEDSQSEFERLCDIHHYIYSMLQILSREKVG